MIYTGQIRCKSGYHCVCNQHKQRKVQLRIIKNKQAKVIQFECEKRDLASALNYFNNAYPLKWKYIKNTISLGYNVDFMILIESLGQRLDITKKTVTHITAKSLVRNNLILKRWGKIYSNHM